MEAVGKSTCEALLVGWVEGGRESEAGFVFWAFEAFEDYFVIIGRKLYSVRDLLSRHTGKSDLARGYIICKSYTFQSACFPEAGATYAENHWRISHPRFESRS